MESGFTKKAETALQNAAEAAFELGHGCVGSEHILIGLLRTEECIANAVLVNNGVEESKVVELIKELIVPEKNVGLKEPDSYTPRAARILENARKEAKRFKSGLIGTEHIFIGMLKEQDCVATRLLGTIGVKIQKAYIDTVVAMGEDSNNYKDEVSFNRKNKKSQTPTLDQYSRDLTALAEEGKLDPVIGREREIQRVIQIGSRRTKNNPCLVGEPGVGKTAVVEGIAIKIAEGNVPDTIRGKRLLTLDLSGMVAGSKYRGEFEERIKKVIAEVMEHPGILLFIDELHTIIGAGGAEGALDASNILKPALARGEVQVIGATTIEEYRKYIEKDAALERRFQPVQVNEPTEEESIEILKGIRPLYERHHNVEITDEGLEAAVHLSARYVNDRFLPDKAIDLMDEAAAKTRLGVLKGSDELNRLKQEMHQTELLLEDALREGDIEKARMLKNTKEELASEWEKQNKKNQRANKRKVPVVGENEIADVVAGWTKIPVSRLTESEAARLQKLEETLHKRVIGQEEAVSAVAKAVRRGRVGLKDPKRPIGSFLFLGPTGVGKTEVSKALAEAVFGNEDAMIRVDMSEYMEKHSVSKMIGSPPGYVGHEDGGQLSEKVRRNPFSVILFDEIEKAHPDVFNILLQVLDDGHITDSQGRKVDFKNTIIIMTSNLGSQYLLDGIDADGNISPEAEKEVMEDLQGHFRPEFLNRLDEIIMFKPLSKENIGGIIRLLMDDLNKRLSDREIKVALSPEAEHFVVEHGYDPVYGARPLKRFLQKHVETLSAKLILEDQVRQGDTILIDVKDGALTASVQK